MGSKVIGKVLRKLRKAAGFSQQALADEVGLKQSMISQIELGDRPLPEQRLARFAEVLGVSEDELRPTVQKQPTTEEPEQAVRTDAQVNRWRDALARADLDPMRRLMISILPAFMHESGLVLVTREELVEDANLPDELIEQHWDAVLVSPWVERVSQVEWALRLVFPDNGDTNEP